MTDQKITLRTGFQIAHGDYADVMYRLEKANVKSGCYSRLELVKKIQNPDYKITGSTGTKLKDAGVLDEDGLLDSNTIEVIKAALPEEGTEKAALAAKEACPVFFLNEAHLFADHD